MGQMVKASSLSLGNYVRDPRRRDRILQVKETGSSVFAQGITEKTSKYHRFFSNDDVVEQVTNPTTEELS